ncbi:MAG: hypothetical protein WC548_00125 [Candidatus Pacearchaeota archaeon]
MKKCLIVIFLIFLIFGCFFVSADEIMTVEANIFKSVFEPEISIQVPDYLFFGNLTRGEKSEELKVIVNNTGNVDVIITPTLADFDEEFFNYSYFRLRKTSGNATVPFEKIGDFSFSVDESDNEYCYMTLDLTDYQKEIESDLIGYRADIKFIAMAK